MRKKLFFEAILKMFLGIVITGLLIFIPAGTIDFLNGWIFMCILFAPMFVAGLVLMIRNPELLKQRLDAKETQKEQRYIVLISGIIFVFGFVISGIDYRFGWSDMPSGLTILSMVVFLMSYLVYAEVIRENKYLSRTIKVTENQEIIEGGLYGIVRHPMYTSTIFMFLSIPIILGSFYGFLIFLAYPLVISRRIKYEEKILEKELKGYVEYKKKTKYRLIPFVW